MDRHLTGRWGEEKAAAFLRRKGYKIIGMNYACRMGEIDIIARNRKFIVFAEVKLRKSAAFATPFKVFDSLINILIITHIDTTFPRHISRQKHDIKHDM